MRLTMDRQRYQLIPSKDIDDQRILESDWSKDSADHTQPWVVVFVLFQKKLIIWIFYPILRPLCFSTVFRFYEHLTSSRNQKKKLMIFRKKLPTDWLTAKRKELFSKNLCFTIFSKSQQGFYLLQVNYQKNNDYIIFPRLSEGMVNPKSGLIEGRA